MGEGGRGGERILPWSYLGFLYANGDALGTTGSRTSLYS